MSLEDNTIHYERLHEQASELIDYFKVGAHVKYLEEALRSNNMELLEAFVWIAEGVKRAEEKKIHSMGRFHFPLLDVTNETLDEYGGALDTETGDVYQ